MVVQANGTASSAHAREAERSVLGSMLLHADVVDDVRGQLRPGDFWSAAHQSIYRAIVATYDKRADTDILAVQDIVGAEFGDMVVDLAGAVISVAGVDYHAEIVRTAADRRRLVELARMTATRAAGAERREDLDEVLADHQRALEEIGEHGPRRGLKTMSLGELLALPAPSWLLDRIIPAAGLVVLAAEPKTGKSLLAQDWAMRMVHGVGRWHERSLTPGPVLYLAGEGVRSMKVRAAAWIAAHPQEQIRHGLAVTGLPLLSDPQGVTQLDATIAEHRPRLVVIDTLNIALGDADENDAGQVGPVMAALSRMVEQWGCTILLIHHLNKGEPGRPLLQRIRGSGAIVAAMDAILGLTADPDGALRLETVMRDAEAGKLSMRLAVTPISLEDGTTGVHLVSAGQQETVDPAALEEADRRARNEAAEERVQLAVKVLRELGGQTSSKDAITTRMGGKAQLARAALATAMDRGLIVPEGTARSRIYRAPEVSGVCVSHPPDLYRDGDDDVPSSVRPRGEGRRGTERDDGTIGGAETAQRSRIARAREEPGRRVRHVPARAREEQEAVPQAPHRARARGTHQQRRPRRREDRYEHEHGEE